MVYMDEGHATGLFIELAEYFAAVLDWDLIYVEGTWGETLDRLEAGEIDLLPSVGYTQERARFYQYNDRVVFVDSGVLFTSENFQPKTVFDLQNKTVAALGESVFTTGFQEYASSFGIDCPMIYTKDNNEVMEAIARGDADAGVCIYSLGTVLAKNYPVDITTISFSPLALHYAVWSGRNGDIIDGINRILDGTMDDPDGEYSRIYHKWMRRSTAVNIPAWIWIGGGMLLFFGLFLTATSIILKRRVDSRTRNLRIEAEEKSRALQLLGDEKERLRVTLQSIGEGVFATDSQGRILMANGIAETLTGWSEARAMGLPIQDAFHLVDGDNEGENRDPVDVVLKSGLSVAGREALLRSRGGEDIPISLSCAPIKDDKTVMGAVLIFRDIMKEKRISEQLHHAQKMEAIGTLAGGIAHDFNNILSAIIGYTDLAMEGLNEQDQSYAHLVEVLNASSRAQDIVSRILSISRHDEIARKHISLNILLQDSIKMLKAVIPSSIKIISLLTDSDLIIHADSSQIHQILLNLITNASHAITGNGGEISISLERAAPEGSDLPFARLSIGDNGAGIRQEVLKKIFEPYFSTKDKTMGTGLGLFITHDIVKSYGGFISVESEYGVGTMFHVYLPLSDKPGDGNTDPIAAAQRGGGEMIFLVDDEPAILDILTRNLISLGYRVWSSSDSTEAFEQFRNDPDSADLVITDRTMPGMDGYELARRIKSQRRSLPVIMCTGYSDPPGEKESSLAVDIVLRKPVEKNLLAATIGDLLRKRRTPIPGN
ncbi:MAG: response regulator [Spirochaetales bacterium]|nr:response regulator [Spirochaetales bacterium]